MRLPNFLILGANKAGTTALSYYCAQHPEIFFSPIKEPMFFTALQGSGAARGKATLDKPFFSFYLEDYLELFSGATTEKMLGEGSTSYLANPGCSAWIRKVIPDVKLIAILRNPFERALSCYKMYNGNGVELRPFEQVLRHELENGIAGIPQGQQYLQLGLYGSQLQQFLNYFSKDQVFIADYEELNTDSVKFLGRIFDFLNVSKFVPEDLKRVNPASSHYSKEQDQNLFAYSASLKADVVDFYREDIKLLNEIVQFDALRWLR